MSFSEGERICQHFPFVGFFHSLHWSFRTPTGTIAGWRLSPHVIHRESSVVFCALCTRGTVLLLWTSVVCAPAGVHRCFLAWCCWCLHFLFRCVCAIIKPGSFESFFLLAPTWKALTGLGKFGNGLSFPGRLVCLNAFFCLRRSWTVRCCMCVCVCMC